MINDNKLKVMLTPEDMRRYEINCDTIDYDNTETRRAFWSILDEAKYKTGFDAASDRVFIQVYPSKEGGCEMYVTKLGAYCCEDEDSPSEARRGLLRRGNTLRSHTSVYRFEKLDLLLDVCAKLRQIGYHGSSSAYASQQKPYYYLVITEKACAGYIGGQSFGAYSFIAEYGRLVSTYGIHSYITEHCKCICPEDAVEILAKLS